MKKAILVKKLQKEGYEETHGRKHDVFKKDGCQPITVPRHNEIAEGTAKAILKQAGVK